MTIGKVRFDGFTAILTSLFRFCFCVVGIAGVLASLKRDLFSHLPFLLASIVFSFHGAAVLIAQQIS